jgi:hypothetical protein
LTISKVRTAINHLKSSGEIAVNKTPKFSIITVCKWKDYQEADSQVAVSSQSLRSQIATYEEGKKERKKEYIQKPGEVSEQTWNDFLAHRKQKKAPVTKTAINRIKNQADKVNWTLEEALQEVCSRGWQSFSAEYVKEKKSNQQNQNAEKEKIDELIFKSTGPHKY